jgi:hypothetical protein
LISQIKCKPVDAVQMNPNHLKKTHLFKLQKKPGFSKGPVATTAKGK